MRWDQSVAWVYYLAFIRMVQYRSMTKRVRIQRRHDEPVSWLPVDSRLFSPLFSFSHVHGVGKIFIAMEMVLAVGVVFGAAILVVIHFFV